MLFQKGYDVEVLIMKVIKQLSQKIFVLQSTRIWIKQTADTPIECI